ncbi:MAG: tRNA pseudouridine(38-40) synthase TruA [Acholeplasmataceae bacterium]|nr:tRNA pseudouridine(38-40) synthase TruA [Acholeplasmataceae bacterium]
MRYKCTCSYDGSLFHGFQIQKDLRTVQEEIENVLLIINKKKTIIYPSGRTDTGVHALNQVFHFNSDITMEEESMRNAINSRLPRDIYIRKVEKVSDNFHARYDVLSKEYHYLIDFGTYDPLQRNYRYYFSYRNFNMEDFKQALLLFKGEHDFRSFTKNQSLSNTVRTIYAIDFEQENSLLRIKIVGNGFMHNMVRILVAMALEVGKGKISLADIKSITAQKNRRLSPKIVPPSGLYLVSVNYKE